jgi:hypothetical protein
MIFKIFNKGLATTGNRLVISIPLFGCNARIDYLIIFLHFMQCNKLVNGIVL